jgi:flagellar hook-associated protein 1 FlgK
MNASVAGLVATAQSTTTTQGSASSAAQVETLAIGSGATDNETLQVVVTAAGMNNSPKTIPVAVNSGDSAATIAGDIATALGNDPDVGAAGTGFFTVSTNGSDVVLTANTAADNDSTMNASVTGLVAPGDGSNALAIFNLSSTGLNFSTGNGAGTISDTADNFYDSMISDLGVASSQASNDVTNQNALVTSLNTSRQSVSGVSLDEEMTNMVQEQSAYEAAAKLVNVIENMMQTVIDMVGGTG